MLNPDRQARVAGSHFVSEFDFLPEVQSQFTFPEPFALIDSTLRKTHFTAGHTTSRLGYQRIAAALVDLGIKDESINISWSGSPEPAPQDWALLEAVVEGDFDFRLNVYTDTLLGDGEHYQPVGMRQTVDMLAEAGVRVAAPGIVPAPHETAQQQQIADLAEYFEYARSCGLDTTITLANVGRRDFDQMLMMANHAVRLGARRLDLMDSTSSLSPEAMKVFIRRFLAGLTVPVPITMHSHDEFGLATACAIAATTAGASPDVSVNGMSYRAGFAPLEEVVLALETLYGVDTGLRLDRITHVSKVVEAESGVPIPALKPLTGSYAYLKHMPGDAAAAISQGQTSFPPISHGLVPGKMGQLVTWVWGGASSDAMVTALAATEGLALSTDEARVVRRALDAAVLLRSGYPRWLEPDEARALFVDLVNGLRVPRSDQDLRAALAVGCPHQPWIERVIGRAGSSEAAPAPSAAVIEAARTELGLVDPEELVTMAATFSPLGSEPIEKDVRGRLSEQEEAGISQAETALREEIVELAAKYQATFGLTYVASTAGLGADDVLARLQHRLQSAPGRELAITRREVRTIVDNRLIGQLTPLRTDTA